MNCILSQSFRHTNETENFQSIAIEDKDSIKNLKFRLIRTENLLKEKNNLIKCFLFIINLLLILNFKRKLSTDIKYTDLRELEIFNQCLKRKVRDQHDDFIEK